MSQLTQKERLETLEWIKKQQTFNKLAFFRPYTKQKEFMEAGATKRERLLMAGNQLGKTEIGAYETALHLTGLYPPDWKGRRWDRPTKCWAAGETSMVVRDAQQKKLCGEPGVEDMFGSGMIPKHLFIEKPSLARGVTDAFDTVQVRHKSGGISVLRFKSYEQGRTKFQAETLDFVWCDEEPDLSIYSECLTRITATQGMVFATFTPLKGMSMVVQRFMSEPSDNRHFLTMVIEDAEHISAEERIKIIEGYPAHEREARARGIPMLGEGRIFQFSDEAISEPITRDVPSHWAKIWGIDFGIGHPFAAVLILWDRDADIIHVHACIRVADQLPIQHAKPIRMLGASVPIAWPHDGTQREKGTGRTLAQAYKDEELPMLPEHATHPDGSNSVEAGILEMQERMATGRLKVASHLTQWFEEFHMYHRKNGQVVRLKDDLLSATRYAIMMKRKAKSVPLGAGVAVRKQTLATGIDFDYF